MKYIPYGPDKTSVYVVGGGCMRIADMDTSPEMPMISVSA